LFEVVCAAVPERDAPVRTRASSSSSSVVVAVVVMAASENAGCYG
jgi:hypothetical protein